MNSILHISEFQHPCFHKVVEEIGKNIKSDFIYSTNIDEIIKKIVKGNYEYIHFHFIRNLNILKIVEKVEPQIKIGFSLHEFYPFCSKGTLLYDNNNFCNKNLVKDCDCNYIKNEFEGDIDYLKKLINLIFKRFTYLVVHDNFSYNKMLYYKKNYNSNILLFTQKYGIENNIVGINKKQNTDYFNIYYVGSDSEIKGLNILSKLIEKNYNYFKNNNFRFNICAFNDDKINVDGNLKILESFDICKVEFNLSREELYKKNIDCLIIPSIWNETGPMTLYEAFANKISVIISDQESLKEKVVDRVDSYVFKTGDNRDLLKGILWMKNNYKKVILNKNGFEYNSIENFTINLINYIDVNTK